MEGSSEHDKERDREKEKEKNRDRDRDRGRDMSKLRKLNYLHLTADPIVLIKRKNKTE